MHSFRRAASRTLRLVTIALHAPSLLCLLVALFAVAGCQRGEKSCRYYSLVLERAESPDDKRRALEDIKRLPTKDQLKCDDDKVFERFAGKAGMQDNKFRPLLVETMENVGRTGGKLRVRIEKLLVGGLKFNDTAGQIAGVFRTWRLESADTRDPWLPAKETAAGLADAIRRPNAGGAQAGQIRSQLVEALFLAVPDPKDRGLYEDLLIELADTDPAQQSVEVNIKALQYLAELHTQKDQAFDAYVHGLFLHDAARAETFMAGRLALATIPRDKVAKKALDIFQRKDTVFEAWAKNVGLFDWEWQEGPKLAQVLSDVHAPETALVLVQAAAKPIDASETGTPKSFTAVMKALPWQGYITSRIQLTMWALAALGAGIPEDAGGEIAKAAANSALAVEQRTMPLIGLAISGAPHAWKNVLDGYQKTAEMERPDLLTPLAYALDPENLADWDKIVGEDKSEGVTKGREDPVTVDRVKVVRDCATATAAAGDEPAKQAALLQCYVGFLKTGTPMQQEKAAIGVVHLGARGVDAVPVMLEAFNKSDPTAVTIRQILMAGLKNCAKPEHMKAIYDVQQLQVVHGPAVQVWLWEFDVLLNHLFQAAGGKVPMPVNTPNPGNIVPEPAAPGAAPAGAPAPQPAK
jgi:hypothetical protein